MRREIRDAQGRLLGWTENHGSGVDARDAQGRLLGRYDPRRGETRDAQGRLLSRSDVLASLIY